MPLSEREERILADIERQLADDDPRFMARTRRRNHGRGWSRQAKLRAAIVLAIVGVAGVALLVVSVAFAAAGIVLIFLAILLAVGAHRQVATKVQQSVPPDERA